MIFADLGKRKLFGVEFGRFPSASLGNIAITQASERASFNEIKKKSRERELFIN